MVSDAATRWVCRFVLAAAAARLRCAGVLDADDARVVRAVLAASPRAEAAFDEAAREAAVRFDPVGSAVSPAASVASEFAAAVFAAAAFAAAAFAAVDFSVVDFAARFVVAAEPVVPADSASVDVAPVEAAASGAASFDAASVSTAGRGVRGFVVPDAPELEAVGRDVDDVERDGRFGARVAAGASSPAPSDATGRVRTGRFEVARGVRGAFDDPPAADTPVPVPSGASSS